MLNLESLIKFWCVPDSIINDRIKTQFYHLEPKFQFPKIKCPICEIGLILPLVTSMIKYPEKCEQCKEKNFDDYHQNIRPQQILQMEKAYRENGILAESIQISKEHFSYPYEKLNSKEQKVIDNYINHGTLNLLLVGSVGNHKTTLACALIERWCVLKFVNVLPKISIVKFGRLLELFSESAGFNEHSQYEIQKMIQSDMLLIDDFGITTAHTPAKQAGIYGLIDYRYENNLPTIITSNINPDEIDVRIRSRLISKSTTVHMTGKDERPKSAALVVI